MLGLNVKLLALVRSQKLVDHLVVHVFDADLQDVSFDVLQFDLASGALNERRSKTSLQVFRHFDDVPVHVENFVICTDQLYLFSCFS